jgi:hypothetical protein
MRGSRRSVCLMFVCQTDHNSPNIRVSLPPSGKFVWHSVEPFARLNNIYHGIIQFKMCRSSKFPASWIISDLLLSGLFNTCYDWKIKWSFASNNIYWIFFELPTALEAFYFSSSFMKLIDWKPLDQCTTVTENRMVTHRIQKMSHLKGPRRFITRFI